MRQKTLWAVAMLAVACVAPTGIMAAEFTRDLALGAAGEDVRELQQALDAGGYLKTAPTGYFGSLTQAALAAWQKEKGIAPALGYFGPKSRAVLSARRPLPPAPLPIPDATPSSLILSAAAAELPGGVLVSNPDGTAAARVPVLGVRFESGKDVALRGLQFRKTGLLSDNGIQGAYLVHDDRVVGVYSALSRGVIDFRNLEFILHKGETETLWLAIDPAAGLAPGNPLAFELSAAGSVNAANEDGTAEIAQGAFPIRGPEFRTVSVSNPSLARLEVAALPIGENVQPGTAHNLVGAWNFTVSNNRAYLRGITFLQTGEADKEAIVNLELFVNGRAAGKAAGIEENGALHFGLASKPVLLQSGSNLLELYADITGAPGDGFLIEIRDGYDIYAADAEYGVTIPGQAAAGTEITIQGGTLLIW